MYLFSFFRLLYQQQSMWMATFWLSQTTCLYTTIPNMEGGLAALTPQKVRPLLIWKMVGTHLHVFFICNASLHHILCWYTTTFYFYISFLFSLIKQTIKNRPLVFLTPYQTEYSSPVFASDLRYFIWYLQFCSHNQFFIPSLFFVLFKSLVFLAAFSCCLILFDFILACHNPWSRGTFSGYVCKFKWMVKTWPNLLRIYCEVNFLLLGPTATD